MMRVVFALFVFSVPFEVIDTLSTGHTFSLSRLIGLITIGVALTQINICFARPPAAFWLFAVYLFIVALVGVSESSGYWELVRTPLLTLLQLLVLFWIASNLLRYPPFARSAIAALAAATLVVAMLSVAGIGLTVIPGTGRVSMFGEDPNTVAGMLSVGILAWIGLGRELSRRGVRASKFWLVPCMVIGLAVIRTGSRGGVVALLAGVLALLVGKREARQHLRSGWMVIGIASALVLGLLASATNVRRWGATLAEGKAAGREQIYPAAWKMFLERPVLGWGPARNIVELGVRVGSPKEGGDLATKDTHNGLLWVLTEVGLVGAIPNFLALWLCVRAAWRGRARAYGVLPFALVVCVLMVNMSVTWQKRKFYWLILGLGIASARTLEEQRPRQIRPSAPLEQQALSHRAG